MCKPDQRRKRIGKGSNAEKQKLREYEDKSSRRRKMWPTEMCRPDRHEARSYDEKVWSRKKSVISTSVGYEMPSTVD